MLILAVHSGFHDGCAALFDDYKLVAAVALERLTRQKIDGGRIPDEAIEECLTIAGVSRRDIGAVAFSRAAFPWRYCTHMGTGRRLGRRVQELQGRVRMVSLERELMRAGHTQAEHILDTKRLLAGLRLPEQCVVHFYNHHRAHGLAALFHTDWDDALIYTADGGGDNVQYSHRLLKDGRLTELFGGDEGLTAPTRIDSLGLAYGFATQALGYKMNRHEGKLTGLAALGQPVAFDRLAEHFTVDDAARIDSDFATYGDMQTFISTLASGISREDMAASMQALLEEFISGAVNRLLERHKTRHLALSGGVCANVLLNQRLAERSDLDEIFIYPAMSDQGLAAGGGLDFLLARDGLQHWLECRTPLEHLYYGRAWSADATLQADPAVCQLPGDPTEQAANHLAQGAAVALYSQAMEHGPRALGARTILANPADSAINDTLNDRLGRSEFMPFAPVVAAADADEVFHLPAVSRYAARFMTITCAVRKQWRDRIPAVVHVDGTARPQVIDRQTNPLYFDILQAFKARTGLPVLINTSFNVHEEPIINTPQECCRALTDGRVDFVVTRDGFYGLKK
ncbi:MAG: carbamoyltransferase C-terminal domain-containing protein [Alphaproteobacteria bacterium]